MKYEITKGSEKDFDGAPEWAMVLLKHDIGRFVFAESKSEGAKRTDMYDAGCCLIKSPDQYEIIAERRLITELVWDGEGLPPVGAECEWLDNREAYVPVKIMYSSKDAVVIRGRSKAFNEDVDIPLDPVFEPARCKFRPIRSPEDVARDEAIKAMICAARSIDHTTLRGLVETLYDAGYRKAGAFTADLKINITTDEMWREFEKKSDMDDVRRLMMDSLAEQRSAFNKSRRGSF